MSNPVPVAITDELKYQLRCVFDACDTNSTGYISLKELANLSRSHVENGQVEEILQIIGPVGDDTLSFDQFCQRVVGIMAGQIDNEQRTDGTCNTSIVVEEVKDEEIDANEPNPSDDYLLENLGRKLSRGMSVSATSSPRRLASSASRSSLSSCSTPNKKYKLTTSRSQVRLTGRIPLVNTSSEEEDEEDLEDSFDRQITASLEAARPRHLESPQFQRGSSARSTVRRAAKGLTTSNSVASFSHHLGSESPRQRKGATSGQLPRTASDGKLLEKMKSPPGYSTNDSLRSSLDSSPLSTPCSTPTAVRVSQTRQKVEQLEEQVGKISVVSKREDYDSPSSGIGSLKAELEDELAASLQLAKSHSEERMKALKLRHEEELRALNKEREMEKANQLLLIEQYKREQKEKCDDIRHLKEKVRLLIIEKEHSQEQLLQCMEKYRAQSPTTAVGHLRQEEDCAVFDATNKYGNTTEVFINTTNNRTETRSTSKEDELMIQVKQLSNRVERLDSELADVKEDNIVLRSQNKHLKEAMEKGKEGKFKLFGGSGIGRLSPTFDDLDWADPRDIRTRIRELEEELSNQKEVNQQLKNYMGEVLVNIMVENPQILEKK